MVHVSITRLRMVSGKYILPLVWHTFLVNRQIKAADGCLSSEVRGGPDRIFWTKSVWRDEAAMRAFMASGAHMRAMPKLKHWCDEASAAHWSQENETVAWAEVKGRMAQHGWTSKVLKPSPAHASGSPLGSSQ
ncbi:MAG: putative quinol monooxygenase [Rhodospirillaceae bacterium]